MSGTESHRLNRLAYDAVEHGFWLPKDADEKLQRAKSSNSLLRFLFNEITKAAVGEAVARKIDPEDFEYEVLPQAIQIVKSIQYAFVREPFEGDIKAHWNFWKHQDFALQRIQNKDVPYLSRSELEGAATEYLNSPFRSGAIDRILIDGLMALEIFAFGDEMLNPFVAAQSPLKQQNVLWGYIKGRFYNVVFAGLTIGLVVWLSQKGIIGESGTLWSFVVVLILTALLFLLSTVFLPVAWLQQRKQRARVLQLLNGMLNVYTELKSDGAISAQHVLGRAKEVSSQGVAWPAPLFAMLDDVIRRTGRF